MPVITTLSFYGHAEEAINLYQDLLGAETLFLMRFRDCPDKSLMQPGMEDMIFHATFRIGNTELKASDVGYSEGNDTPNFEGFSLALNPESVERGKEIFEGLSEGGNSIIPFAESSFTGWYGIVVDKFGISWKINVEKTDE